MSDPSSSRPDKPESEPTLSPRKPYRADLAPPEPAAEPLPEPTLPYPPPSGPERTLSDIAAPLPGRLNSKTEDWRPDVPPQPLKRIGDYEILAELGRGGMGVVYKALHVTLKRVVALKMIRSGRYADPEEVKRFQFEAEAVARLQHPNIVQIFEVGTFEGCPFFALEFLEGGSLDKALAHTPQPPHLAAALIATLARAMHVAHLAHIVHRDLKPANILLQRTKDQVGSVSAALRPLSSVHSLKITDFGLAKQLDDESGHTQTGLVMGTPSYMAPEQAEGRIKDIGPGTDVWALAAILYEMLTGRAPFKGTSVRATIEQVRTQEPVPPRRLEAKTPRDLETICLKGLQKDPRRRYASAAALADDLQRFLDDRPILARPVSSWERAVKWARRQPALAGFVVAITLFVVAAAVGGVFYGLYQSAQAIALQRQLDRVKVYEERLQTGQDAFIAGRYAEALRAFEQARDQLEEGDERHAPLDEKLSRAKARAKEQQARIEAQASLQILRKKEGDYLKHQDEVLLSAVDVRPGDAAANHQRIRREAPAALTALGVNRAAPSLDDYRKLHAEKSRFERFASGCLHLLLAWADAEAAPERPEVERLGGLKEALELLATADALAKAHGLALPRVHYQRRADVLARLGRGEEAVAEQKVANALKTETSLDHFLAALDAARQSNHVAALAACESALRDEPDHVWAQYLRALCYLHLRNWGMARVALDSCLARRPDFRWALLQRASAQVGAGAYAQAEKDFDAALAAAPEKDMAFRLVLTSRGAARVKREDWGKALADLDQAIQLQPHSYQAWATLAQAHRLRGNTDEALAALNRAVKENPGDGRLRYSRAELHVLLRDLDAARTDYEKAIALLPKGSRSRERASALVQLGYLKHLAGEFDDALTDFDAALIEVADFPDAHRQKAETLLRQGRHADAARELDGYLRTGKPLAVIYKARGLLYDEQREYRAALEAYRKALELEPDAETYALRGWVYLKADAPRLAVPEFDAGLKVDGKNTDALCGRARALARVGEMRDAVRDAEAALQIEPRSARLMFHAACVHAAAFAKLEEPSRPSQAFTTRDRSREQARALEADRARDRAVELLREALAEVKGPDGKKAFWRDYIRGEPSLLPIRRARGLLELARKYAG